MKYPKEYLDEIKLRLKVSQVVGKTVQLKKRGKEFIGLSPFKNEKSPSFTVSDEKEFYHCFSSSEHGNIFDFLMKTKSIGFGEAVRTLAAEAGMQPYRFSNFDQKKDLRFQTYKNIFRDYTNYFNQQLFDQNNQDAINYLLKRGLKKNIIEGLKPHGYVEGREYVIIKVPNIIDISYGRGVGYTFTEHDLGEEIHKISATKIRKEMRQKGELKAK